MKTGEALLLELNETDKEMSEIKKKVNQLKKQKKKIIAQINDQGYLVEKGKLIANKLLTAIEWTLDYNDYYVGEHGMHTINTSGMIEISEEEYATIIKMIDANDEELGDYLDEEILAFDSVILRNTIKYATCTRENDVIHFIWEEEGNNDDTMNENSFLKIHKGMDMLQIKNTKVEYEAIAP